MIWFKRRPKPEPDYRCPFCHEPPRIVARRRNVLVDDDNPLAHRPFERYIVHQWRETIVEYSLRCPNGHLGTDWWEGHQFAWDEWKRMVAR